MQTINGSIFAGFKLCDPAIKKVSGALAISEVLGGDPKQCK